MRPITSWDQVPIILDLVMAGRIVGMSPEYLKKRCQKGNFPGFKEGVQWRITKEALKQHVGVAE